MPTRSLVCHLNGLGSIRGALERDVVAFRGVPYAAPPVGALRFSSPQAPVPWRGTRDATANGPIAPQTQLRLERAMGAITAAQDEDCLSLTIWTPADAVQNAPVLVWLHGGGFLSGAGSLPWYDGGNLAARHGVVVVGVNYRLGALGFLAVPGRLPGNLGLLDQIAALRWVQSHIESFGGAPDQVTVIGQSGGAHNIASMLASPDTEGLFRRAILQSPPLGIGLMSSVEAAHRGGVFLQQLGLDPEQPDLVDSLRELTLPRLLAAQVKTTIALGAVHKGDLRPPFLPAEGPPHDFPGPELVERAAANAVARGVDVLVGWTRDEARLYVAAIPALAGNSEALALMTEATFAAPCRTLAASIAQVGGRAFLYRFDWQSPSAALGACHCLDIPFSLGTWRAWMKEPLLQRRSLAVIAAVRRKESGTCREPATRSLFGPHLLGPKRRRVRSTQVVSAVAGANEAQIEQLSDEMMRRWAGFATNGDPGFAPARADGSPMMVFDRESRVLEG